MSNIKELLAAKVEAEGSVQTPVVDEPATALAQAAAKVASARRKGPEYAAGRLRRIIRSNGTAFMPTAAGVYAPDNRDDYELCEYYVSAGVLERLD